MTIETRDYKNTFIGDGVTTDFPFTFRPLLEEWVNVSQLDPEVIAYVQGIDYTVTLSKSSAGGTISMSVPFPDGAEGQIYRLVPPYQTTRFIREQDIDTEKLEFLFDRMTILIQQIEQNIDFLIQTTIPELRELIDSILNLTGTVSGPGASRVPGGIPAWTSAGAATLDNGLVGNANGQILSWNNDLGIWEIATGVPTLDMGEVVVPGVTDANGLPYWDATDGTALGTIAAGEDGEVLVGNTGAPPSFETINAALKAYFSAASNGDVITFDGADFVADAPPATPTGQDSFFTRTASPRGLKVWSLSKPAAYSTTGIKARTTGSTEYISDSVGVYAKLTTSANTNNDVRAYTTSDDIASTRDAFPLWLTRIITGASVAAVRMMIGFGASNLNDVRAGIVAASSALFRFDTALGDTNWMCVTCTEGGISTVVDSGVAVNVDTRYVLAVDMTTENHVKFLIDGVEVADISTNLPKSDDYLDWMIICRTLAAAQKSIAIGPVNMSHG